MARLRSLLPTLALAAAPAFALAQYGNPAGMAPGTLQTEPGTPAPGQPNSQDRLFAQLAAAGGMGEIEAARLAQSKTGDAALRAFAERMVRDHSAAGDQLAALAQQGGIALPARLDPDRAAALERLRAQDGTAFDSAYVQDQIVDHQKTLQILEWELSAGQEPGLQRFAAATLPVVLEHLRLVQQIYARMTGTAAPEGIAAARRP